MEQVRSRGSVLKVALALTCVVLAVELAGGLLSHSLALLSDAGHVLTDVFALGLAWFAVAQANRPADARRSYGYHRVSILAALVNSVTLIVIVIAIAYEAIRRLAHPEPVQGGIVIVAAGVVILFTGWLSIDPLLSLGIAVLIAFGAWGIVRETVNLLMEGTPREIDLAAVTQEITGSDLVTGMHDLHVWALSSDEMALSCHVVVGECPLGDAEHVVRDLESRLCEKFDIGHTTIQVESCHPCGEIHHGAGDHNHPHEHAVFSSGAEEHPRAAGSSARPR